MNKELKTVIGIIIAVSVLLSILLFLAAGFTLLDRNNVYFTIFVFVICTLCGSLFIAPLAVLSIISVYKIIKRHTK